MIPISYNVRSLVVRRTTTIATALGIALVVFVLASSLMLGFGIERTMGRSGRPDNAFVMRKGSDAELASSIETRFVSLILAAPGVARDGSGAPLGSGEIVIVITAEDDPAHRARTTPSGRAAERRQHGAGGDEQAAERAVDPAHVMRLAQDAQDARGEPGVAAHHDEVGEEQRRAADRVLRELRERGIERASDFSWEDSARRLLAELELAGGRRS